MINTTSKPETYCERVQWYVADWRDNTAELFTTKAEAIERAKELYSGHPHHVVNVDWLPWNQSCRQFSRSFTVIDRRANPVF